MPEFQYQLIPYEIHSNCKIFIPDPAEVKAVHDQSAQSEDEAEFPYWTRIWPSAKGMAEYLFEDSCWIQNKRIMEFGAGLGLPSFSVAHLAKSVVVSDASRGAVQLLDINIKSIGCLHASALQIDWNYHHQPISGIDTLLLSDVCYDPHQYDGLL
jgi:predicted nicotinamide N-methyase